MMQKHDIAALLERVKAATGPDHSLDKDLWEALTPGCTRRKSIVTSSTDRWAPYELDETRDPTGRLIIVPNYTGSIDAALALVEKALPEATCYGVEKMWRGNFDAYVSRNNVSAGHWYFGADGVATAPLAVLAALLTALIAREPAPELAIPSPEGGRADG